MQKKRSRHIIYNLPRYLYSLYGCWAAGFVQASAGTKRVWRRSCAVDSILSVFCCRWTYKQRLIGFRRTQQSESKHIV